MPALGSKMRIDGFFTRTDPKHTIDEEDLADLTSDQRRVVQNVLSLGNTLMHGPAGTGKSMTLKRLVNVLTDRSIRYALTAMTGAAAVGIGGGTVHAFFKGCGLMTGTPTELARKLNKNILTRTRIRDLQVFIVDEISMMDGKFMDLIDEIFQIMRKNTEPFGGVAVLFCGDFYQLPPVSAGDGGGQFAFESQCWPKLHLTTVELGHVFRQDSDEFISILQRVRVGKQTLEDLSVLQLCTKTDLVDSELPNEITPTSLFATNGGADAVNTRELKSLVNENKASLRTFEATVSVVEMKTISEEGTKELFRSALNVAKHAPCPQTLELCLNAQVMLRTNLDIKGGLANGSRGVVMGFNRNSGFPQVMFVNGSCRTILPHEYIHKYPGGDVVFAQVPLILAWAMTIHKSQGATLDAASLDFKGIRTDGQAYVALSRLRSMKYLNIKNFNPRVIKANTKVCEQFPVANQGHAVDDAPITRGRKRKKQDSE